mmetsp:Transcript_18149/g.23514  ORF Transcript_18149/g.23514 Transcript_18149/m.23514 type:complete len:551 (-) Transcript_18149:223-1875(-)
MSMNMNMNMSNKRRAASVSISDNGISHPSSKKFKNMQYGANPMDDPMFLSKLNSNQSCCVGFPCLHFSLDSSSKRSGKTFGSTKLNESVIQSYGFVNDSSLEFENGKSNAKLEQNKDCATENPLSLNDSFNSQSHLKLISEYTNFCQLFQCPPNAGVLIAIRFRLPTIRVSSGDSFHDNDVLALVELLLHNDNLNHTLRHVRRLDISVASAKRFGRKFIGFGSHGAFALGQVIQKSNFIEEIFMSRNRIGSYGAASIFLAASKNSVLRTLIMRKCLIGERGGIAFANLVLLNDSDKSGLCEVDLSCNRIGHVGLATIQSSLEKRSKHDFALIELDLEGNLPFQELMCSITHGLGLLLAFVGTAALSARVKNKSMRHVLSCTIYNFSLITLYTSSTLYHGFFAMKITRRIFHSLDKCAIYILIAGTYTPFMMIPFAHKPIWSVYLLSFIWICGLSGIYVDATMPLWQYKGRFSLAMYLLMGWASMLTVPDFRVVLPSGATTLLSLGGLLYTAGVPFFVRNTNLDHSIWHIFVLAGSFAHWLAVYKFIVFLP